MAAPKVNIRIDGDASGYTSALRKSERETQKAKGKIGSAFSGIGAKMSGLAGPAAAAGAAIAGAAIVAWDFAKAAAEDADQAAVLAATLGRVTGATTTQVAAVEDWITATSIASGVADSELRPALGRLATVTGDVTEAQGLLTLAMDIAAATGKPLEVVTKAVGRASQGSTGPLEKLTGVINTGGKGAAAWAPYQDRLNAAFGGAQATKADTYGGKLQKISNALDEAQEALGENLLPYLEDFTAWLTSPEGQKAIEDTASAVEDLASSLSTLWEWFQKVDNLAPEGFLWNFRGWDADNYWPDNWPWGNPGSGRTTSSTATRATATTINVTGALDPLTTAQTVRRALASDAARGGTVRVRQL